MNRTVYLVDDDEAVRHALTLFLESQGFTVRNFGSAEEFIMAGIADFEGVLVLDVRMGRMSGLELQAELKHRNIQLPIIFITGHGDVQLSVLAMRAGAITFLEKPFSNKELLAAVDEAFQHARTSMKDHLRKHDATTRFAQLTPREKEVMILIVEGRMNKEIARGLGVSYRTVEVHRAKVMQKMKAKSLPELVRLADLCDLHDSS